MIYKVLISIFNQFLHDNIVWCQLIFLRYSINIHIMIYKYSYQLFIPIPSCQLFGVNFEFISDLTDHKKVFDSSSQTPPFIFHISD